MGWTSNLDLERCLATKLLLNCLGRARKLERQFKLDMENRGKVLDHLKYLGIWYSANGSYKKEVSGRLTKAWKNWMSFKAMLTNVGLPTNKEQSRTSKHTTGAVRPSPAILSLESYSPFFSSLGPTTSGHLSNSGRAKPR